MDISASGNVRNRDHGICRAENTRPRAARPRNALHAAGKFQDEGLIEETQTDGRKRSYRITEKGKAAFQDELARLKACVHDGEEENA